MNCDLHPGALTLLDRARACARDVVAPAASDIDRSGRVPRTVRDAARAVVPVDAMSDALAFVAVVEELAVVSAAVALAAVGDALGASSAAECAPQWPGLRGADADGLRAALAEDARWGLAVTAVLVGTGKAAVEQSRASLNAARDAGATRDAAEAPLADAATMVDGARLLLWDAACRTSASAAAAARGMARLQALDAVTVAIAAAERATSAEASRPGAVLERISRDAATVARVFGEVDAAQGAVAAAMLPV